MKSERDLKVSPTLYYRTKYLKAYLALIEQRQEGASNEFSQLKGSFDQFSKSIKTNLTPEKVLKDLAPKGVSEIKELPPYLEVQMSYLSEWLGADVALGFEKEIRFQVALNKEMEKMNILPKPYSSQLNLLKAQSFKLFSHQYSAILVKLNKSLETLSLKAELGRLDVFWLNHTEGARNLDEVIENYKQTTKSFENYIEL